MSSEKEDIILLAENERGFNTMLNIIKINAVSKVKILTKVKTDEYIIESPIFINGPGK